VEGQRALEAQFSGIWLLTALCPNLLEQKSSPFSLLQFVCWIPPCFGVRCGVKPRKFDPAKICESKALDLKSSAAGETFAGRQHTWQALCSMFVSLLRISHSPVVRKLLCPVHLRYEDKRVGTNAFVVTSRNHLPFLVFSLDFWILLCFACVISRGTHALVPCRLHPRLLRPSPRHTSSTT